MVVKPRSLPRNDRRKCSTERVAAVLLHTLPTTVYDSDGVPLCSIGLRMVPIFCSAHTNSSRALPLSVSPLLPSSDETDRYEPFQKGNGSSQEINDE